MQFDRSATAVRRVGAGLLIAVGIGLLLATLLFVLVGHQQERVPFLNVQLLPDEEKRAEHLLVGVLERPLFWEERRPVVPPVVEVLSVPEPEPEPAIEPLEGVRLLGIMARGDHYLALLEVDGIVQRVAQNASVKQWTVSSIEPHRVLFANRNKKSLLTLEREIHQSIKLEAKP